MTTSFLSDLAKNCSPVNIRKKTLAYVSVHCNKQKTNKVVVSWSPQWGASLSRFIVRTAFFCENTLFLLHVTEKFRSFEG